ncbi:hypothetical protein OSB04_021704 [Centaurea solstitialis]|uniref:Reverse transcriptase n=1 Tax=Centaurea solstitialis TaxID=347529 RepID=A0AA38T5Z9_9ASTR|nr:hypothetical protein OSB04_021704 [Centaurea solstitialis]
MFVCVDDILLIGNNLEAIHNVVQCLSQSLRSKISVACLIFSGLDMIQSQKKCNTPIFTFG